MLESKKEFSCKKVNDVQAASEEVVEELDIKGLANSCSTGISLPLDFS